MDLNEYTMTWLVRRRLRELEAEAQRQRLVASARAADVHTVACASSLSLSVWARGSWSSLISSCGGDRELENEVRGENRRRRSRIGQRIDFVQRKAAHARRERNEQIEQFTTRQTAGLVPPYARRVCRIEHIHVDAEEDMIRAAGDFSDPGERPLRSAAAHRARRQLSKSDLVDEALR